MGIQPPRAVLLVGAPGTGKTMLARVVAAACHANFVSVCIPDILRSAVGDSEKAIADVFRLAEACRCVPVFYHPLIHSARFCTLPVLDKLAMLLFRFRVRHGLLPPMYLGQCARSALGGRLVSSHSPHICSKLGP